MIVKLFSNLLDSIIPTQREPERGNKCQRQLYPAWALRATARERQQHRPRYNLKQKLFFPLPQEEEEAAGAAGAPRGDGSRGGKQESPPQPCSPPAGAGTAALGLVSPSQSGGHTHVPNQHNRGQAPHPEPPRDTRGADPSHTTTKGTQRRPPPWAPAIIAQQQASPHHGKALPLPPPPTPPLGHRYIKSPPKMLGRVMGGGPLGRCPMVPAALRISEGRGAPVLPPRPMGHRSLDMGQ